MNQNVASRKILSESQKIKFPYYLRFKNVRIKVNKSVFSPKHFNGWRTFTLNLPSFQKKDVLEIGCGTGITSIYLAKNGARRVVAADINPKAVKNTQENIQLNKLGNMSVYESDVFSNLKKLGLFDVIYWNTPFMWQEADYKYRSLLERGLFDPGYKLTSRFLRDAEHFLKPNGQILFGTADFGNIDKLQELVKRYGYKANLIVSAKSKEINPVEFMLYSLKTER